MAEEYGSRTHQGLLATPTRFEVWPAHRDTTLFRISHAAKILSAPWICASDQVIVAHSAQVTYLVEKFQNLDRELATGRDLIAKLGSARGAVTLGNAACDVGEFGDRACQKKVIVRNLCNVARAGNGFKRSHRMR